MDISRRAALAQTLLAGFVNLLVARLNPAHAQNVSYTYDAWGRLTGVTYADGATVQYTYDAGGNRTEVDYTPPPPPPPPPPTPGTVVFDSSTPGAWSWTCTTAGAYDVEIWGPGSSGNGIVIEWDPKWGDVLYPAPGGAGGGYVKRQFSIALNDALSGRIGAGGAQSDPNTSANGGSEASTLASYQSYTLNAGAGVGVVPGTASGGTVNTPGRYPQLVNSWDGGGAGNGGGDQQTASAPGTTPGGGGGGSYYDYIYGGAGANGRVLITAR